MNAKGQFDTRDEIEMLKALEDRALQLQDEGAVRRPLTIEEFKERVSKLSREDVHLILNYYVHLILTASW